MIKDKAVGEAPSRSINNGSAKEALEAPKVVNSELQEHHQPVGIRSTPRPLTAFSNLRTLQMCLNTLQILSHPGQTLGFQGIWKAPSQRRLL